MTYWITSPDHFVQNSWKTPNYQMTKSLFFFYILLKFESIQKHLITEWLYFDNFFPKPFHSQQTLLPNYFYFLFLLHYQISLET